MTKNTFIARIYMYVATGIIGTFLFSIILLYAGFDFQKLSDTNKFLSIAIMLVPILVSMFRNKIPYHKMSAIIKWGFYCFLMLLFSFVIAMFSSMLGFSSVIISFGCTALLFIAVSLIGIFTSFDISSWGKTLAILVPIVLILFLVTFQVKSYAWVDYLISGGFNIFFLLMICVRSHELSKLYDEQAISLSEDSEAIQHLYGFENQILDYAIDMFLWFMYIVLRILMRSKRSGSSNSSKNSR